LKGVPQTAHFFKKQGVDGDKIGFIKNPAYFKKKKEYVGRRGLYSFPHNPR
jgi:hypothetical protein